MRILSIDPSMNRIGWALFDTDAKDFNSIECWNYGAHPPCQGGRLFKLTEVKWHFANAKADHLVCEMPVFFESERGRIAAKSGYTLDLALVIGTIFGVIPGVQLFLYTPQQWKGSVSKAITQVRFMKVFGLKGRESLIVHDTVDAIMLLRYHVKLHFQLTEKDVEKD